MTAAVLILALAPVFGQVDEADLRRSLEGRKLFEEDLKRRARRLTDRAAAEVASRGDWERVRARRQDEMRDMLGLMPWPARTPLNVRVTGKLDQADYVIEKLAFESLPHVYVTANLYLPKPRRERVPAVIYVCGHAGSDHGSKTQYQRHGISFARNGYAAIILDPIQIAETFALHHGIYNYGMFDWLSLGYTPGGLEAWNAIRAIDYLETREEIDGARIGMTGRSGGAAISFFTAAVDERVKAVAPIMGISTWAATVDRNAQRLHCDCMFPINLHQHDPIHQGALIAPRPLLVAHGRKDALFPAPGYEEFSEKMSALYASYGQPEAFRNIVVETGHADSDFLREQVLRWFDRYLREIPERRLEMGYRNAEPASLSVFNGKPPADALNYRFHELFTAGKQPGIGQWLERFKARLGSRDVRVASRKPAQGGRAEELEILSDGFPIRALMRKPAKSEGAAPALLYIAGDGEDQRTINDLLSGVNNRDRAVRLVLYPRGVGVVGWDSATRKDFERNAMFVGETIESLRLADVLAAVEVLRGEPGVDAARIMTAGRGVSGILGLYAALAEPRLWQVMLIDPPATHREGPALLGILRHGDLLDAAGMLAPRRLNFLGRLPEPYRALRHGFQVMNLDRVLEGRADHDFPSIL